jgi:glycosyltransferase involved in cell wall biosynthesis
LQQAPCNLCVHPTFTQSAGLDLQYAEFSEGSWSVVGERISRVALIGNFLPRQCGLATFTTDTFKAFRDRFPDLKVDVYAMDDHPGRYDYPPAVTRAIAQNDPLAYTAAARAIEASGAQAIWVQHEYGIYGGTAGDYLLTLLDRTTLPVIVTLHTVLEKPSADERRVLEGLMRRSAKIVVMAEKGREILCRVYGANPRQIEMIAHGVPDRPLIDPPAMKARFSWDGRPVMLTFGLLAPNKGIETIISALPRVVENHPDLLYAVLGATHPNLAAREGEAYRERLQALAAELGVADNVRLIDGFVEHDELLDYLQAADVYVTPYTNPAQITSGTLSYAVGVGKPVISTPYVHATEILDDGHGVLVPFGDVDAFATEIDRLFADPDARFALSDRAYARGRTMIWPRLAETSMDLIHSAVAQTPRRIAQPRSLRPLKPTFAAVERMSDMTGMLQHSIYSVPDRRHGYCIDDNARALMLVSALPTMDPIARDKWMTVFGAFVQYAWNPDKRRFRNFMNFDRTWCEDQGSEDSNGRTLWALGVTARDAQAPKHRDWAVNLFDATGSLALELGSLRAQSFAMLGAAAMLEARPGHDLATQILRRFPDDHLALLAEARRPEWQWFEIVLAYDNARLPQALIAAGRAIGRDDLIQCGLQTLDWIVGKQTSPEGRFRAVGTESFHRPYAEPLPFDQQPLEAQATVDACITAWQATGDARWVQEAERAYRWFLGGNDLDLPLASAGDGGCFDGLMPTGLNRNQGAESILALQLANCAISGLAKATGSVAGADRSAA